MNLKELVIVQLMELGFPILNTNVKVVLNDHHEAPVTKFDIISTNFIVRIRPGKYNKHLWYGFDTIYRNDLIPEDFIYFVYVPDLSSKLTSILQKNMIKHNTYL